MSAIYPVILCGGSGTRLWPRSRRAHPKPFLPLLGDRTLFQEALDRVADPAMFAEPLIVAGQEHTGLVAAQAGEHRLIVEPAARNTAPAIALAAHLLPRDAIMLVCPSDHHIADEAAFKAGARDAAALASQGHLVSFGISPDRPATGYGYIERGEKLAHGHRVVRFVEKPDLARAQQFLADGGFVWNGGIFAFPVGAFLDELAAHRPDMAKAVAQAASEGVWDGNQFLPDAESFAALSGESVDYAVMENTSHAAVISAEMGWSDIGDWSSLMVARGADQNGNVVRGVADLSDCSGVMVDTDGPRVSVVGIDDVIVVVDGDEILVVGRNHTQAVGKLDGASGN